MALGQCPFEGLAWSSCLSFCAWFEQPFRPGPRESSLKAQQTVVLPRRHSVFCHAAGCLVNLVCSAHRQH